MSALPELEPELGPELKVTAKAAPRIGLIAILAVVLGMILAIDAIVRGFFGTIAGAVGWIPYLGHLIEQPVHKIEQKVVSFLGGLEEHIDSSLAHNIHVTARLLGQLWHSLEYLAANIILIGALLAAGTAHYVIEPLKRWIHAQVRRLEAEIRHAVRIVTHTRTVIVHTVTHVVFPRLKAATVAVPRFIHRELLAIRGEAKRAETMAHHALRKAESIPFPRRAKTWAAAVAIALTALGLGGLRCVNFTNLLKKWKCGLGTLLDDLLSLAVAGIVLEGVCEFLPRIETAFGAVVGPATHLLNEVPLGACEKRPEGWAALSVAAGPLPPTQTLGGLPT